MYNEPKQKRPIFSLRNPSVREALRIAKKYQYKVEIMRVVNDQAYLSVSEPFFGSPYPRHFTSVIRTASYVEAAFEKYNQ